LIREINYLGAPALNFTPARVRAREKSGGFEDKLNAIAACVIVLAVLGGPRR
jgi:ABC-type xylose transport system permease subunit